MVLIQPLVLLAVARTHFFPSSPLCCCPTPFSLSLPPASPGILPTLPATFSLHPPSILQAIFAAVTGQEEGVAPLHQGDTMLRYVKHIGARQYIIHRSEDPPCTRHAARHASCVAPAGAQGRRRAWGVRLLSLFLLLPLWREAPLTLLAAAPAPPGLGSWRRSSVLRSCGTSRPRSVTTCQMQSTCSWTRWAYWACTGRVVVLGM